MAHFAELDSNNVVLRVLVLDNSVIENSEGQKVEQIGIDFLKSLYGQNTIWKQTSYNTNAGWYYDPVTGQKSDDQSKAFRKNYAAKGFTYDVSRDAFVNPKPDLPENMQQYLSFDEFACLWVCNLPPEEDLLKVARV